MIVRPTSRGWMVLASAVTAFLIALVNASLGVSVLAAGCLALAASSFALAWFSVRDVELKREPSTDGYRGHQLGLPLLVSNLSRWHRQSLVLLEPCEFAADGHIVTVVTPLAPNESRHVRRAVPTRRRGVFQLGTITLRGGDPAGLFYRDKEFAEPREVIIYPEVTHVAHMPLALRDRVVASSQGQPIGVSGQGQDFYGVREYRPTDGMRFIHWKASARNGKLMVREFEENTVNQISIFLDVNRSFVSPNDEANFEYLVEVAASIANHLSGMYYLELFSCGSRLTGRQLRGPAQSLRGEILRVLAEITPQDLGMVVQLDSSMELIAPNSILYCLTLHEDLGLEDSFNMLMQKNVDIRWIHAPRSLFVDDPGAVSQEAIHKFASRRGGLLTPRIASPDTPIARLLTDE